MLEQGADLAPLETRHAFLKGGRGVWRSGVRKEKIAYEDQKRDAIQPMPILDMTLPFLEAVDGAHDLRHVEDYDLQKQVAEKEGKGFIID